MRRIIINEAQLKYLIEGVNWGKNSDGSVNLSINHNMSDKENMGTGNVDTRVFGNKNTILHGDSTKRKNSNSLYQTAEVKRATIQFYNNVITFINNGRNGNLEIPDNVEKQTVTAVNRWFEEGKSDNWIIDASKKAIARHENQPFIDTADRIQASTDDKVARYKTGVVTGTNVKYIALFTMNDFNFSDAIKHGTLRQNDLTDKILGISQNDREIGKNGSYKELDVTYDNKYKPNIAQNFSLYNVGDKHYKQQFGLNGEGGYSSISQFLDKSINYAAYALKQENFHPDFIVAPPSSSKFNQYYCTNLSNKLGIPYTQNFFQRNMINVKMDGKNLEEEMTKNGFSQKDIFDFQTQIKNIAYKEIAYFISEPVRNLIKSYEPLFSNISRGYKERTKAPIDDVFDCLITYVYGTIIKTIENDGENIVEKHLVNNFLAKQNKLYTKSYDSMHLFKQISSLITLKIGKGVFNNCMAQTLQLIKQYSNTLKETGYKLRFNTKRFKVTQVPQMYRPYLNGLYIIADEYMNNGELMKQYRNANFLIFDEDINSGATLKLCIDALEEKIPEARQNNIVCLVNAYSGKGW